ncbi:hypothetical protein CLAVI_000249 [Candidatus Clavichlamydia salmonicola]|uniref:YggT family protein n=1 Tax=Candidatus Clavichlamydia salmonicola TaxID=469812 RepID=UPI0018917AFD|nr:YggT family protein [Candidatus Clavichlamydia salmonicola]MBF5050635.1 hypothetical protein [Candidatus Clavichlamydia salmonicola]
MLAYFFKVFFTLYHFLLVVWVIGGFFRLHHHPIMQYVGKCTEPYLQVFRRIVPPLGPLDFSLIPAFICLRLAEWMIIALFR